MTNHTNNVFGDGGAGCSAGNTADSPVKTGCANLGQDQNLLREWVGDTPCCCAVTNDDTIVNTWEVSFTEGPF